MRLVRFLAVLVAVVGIVLLQNPACAAGLPPAACCATGAATAVLDAHPDERPGLPTGEAPADRDGTIGACLMLLVAALLAVLGLRSPLVPLSAAVRLPAVSLPRGHLPAPRLTQLCVLRT
ncbi:hypothetical protein ACFXGA_09795 [Actinosynnema sp. NPDC059335]|uniref:hypothetical protein n=1 Tax=Actinosynnema sp. NPDC059335 TaxID=3346804 RepID=UPI00366FEB47